MALLKLAENNSNVKYIEYRDNLYYNKFTYKLRLLVYGANYTYYCKTPKDLDKKLDYPTTSWKAIKKQDVYTVTENLNALKSIIDIRNEREHNKRFTIRVERHNISIFSNDLDLLIDFEKRIGISYTLDFTKAEVSPFAGTKYFVREPKHKFRVYLKSKIVPDHFKNELKEFFRKDLELYPSAGLDKWLYGEGKRNHSFYSSRFLSSSYFIDYDNESTLSYLVLMHGDFIGRKYKLEKRQVII